MSTADILSSTNALLASHSALLNRVRSTQRSNRSSLRKYANSLTSSSNAPTGAVDALNPLLNLPLIKTPPPSPPLSSSASLDFDYEPSSPSPASNVASVVKPYPRTIRADLSPSKKARCARYENYVPEEETIRNDYSQHYVDSGEWPQNWVVGAEMERRFEEYPKQQKLLTLKKIAVAERALPPTHLSLHTSQTALQGLKFDIILIDPPFSSSFSWDELEKLPIAQMSADPSFVFLWVGSGAGEGLERGREVIAKWGFRRSEDIVWVKTNKETNKGPGTDPPTTSLLTRTKQHCLLGIRGTVRRSTDSWFAHCNVDTDVIIWEGDPTDPTRKPPEIYQLIENFCLGTRRLEIFGRYHSLRRGWVTVTADELNLTPEEVHEKGGATPFDRANWEAQMKELAIGGKFLVPNTYEIDSLRPKSPVSFGKENNNGRGDRTGGGGIGGSERSTQSPGMGGTSGLPMPVNLPNNPMRGGISMGGGLGGGVSLGVVRPNQSAPPQQTNIMSMGPGPMLGGGRGGINNMPGVTGIPGMSMGMGSGMNPNAMGNMIPMNAMAGSMGIGGMMMNNMGMPMNQMAHMGNAAPMMRMQGMDQTMAGFNQMGQMGNMAQMGGLNQMVAMNQMAQMNQMGGQAFMGNGMMWDGSGGMPDGSMGGMGMNMGQGMRQWRNF